MRSKTPLQICIVFWGFFFQAIRLKVFDFFNIFETEGVCNAFNCRVVFFNEIIQSNLAISVSIAFKLYIAISFNG